MVSKGFLFVGPSRQTKTLFYCALCASVVKANNFMLCLISIPEFALAEALSSRRVWLYLVNCILALGIQLTNIRDTFFVNIKNGLLKLSF